MAGRSKLRGALVAVVVMGGGALVAPARGTAQAAEEVPLAWTPAAPLSVALAGEDGASRARGEGLGCDGVEVVDDVHLLLTGPVPAGTLSSLPAQANANVGLAGLRLEPDTSHVTIGDERGTVRLRLDGGACDAPTLLERGRDGVLSGSGALSMLSGTGAYRSATLADGTWSLGAGTAPGADNPWELELGGQLAVLAPGLEVEVLGTYWGNLGVDYLVRVVSVRYRITNTGPGDSYGSELTAVTAGPGVTPLGPVPQRLGDLLAGESKDVTLTFQLGLAQPCAVVILGCSFSTTLTTSLPDARDQAASPAATVGVHAPDLPPPL